MKIKVPWATLAITTFSISLYLLLSGGEPYIYPITRLGVYGVSSVNPIFGGLMFSFTHIGLKHLMANLFVLAIIGTIIEQRLRSIHVFFIFILAGWISGIVYTYLNPDVWVIGASAAISGLIAASFIVDIKKAIPAVIIALYLIPIVVYPTADWIIINTHKTQEEKILSGVQEIKAYNTELKNATGKKRIELLEKINKTFKEIKSVSEKKKKLEKGVQTEAVTPTSHIIHILGGLVALTYLALFARGSYKLFWEDINGIIKFGSSLVSKGIEKIRR